MTRQEFVKRLSGNEYRYTRTCLASGRIQEDAIVKPETPTGGEHLSTIRLPSINVIKCYDEKALFTEDYGILAAVVKTGAGHLYCDRFEPTKQP